MSLPSRPDQRPDPGIELGGTALLLVIVGRRLRERLDESLADIGITMRHFSALGHLAHRSDLSYSDLARRSGVTTQSMRATAAHLEELGAVAAVAGGKGQRARLELTPAGHELLRQAKQLTAAAEADAFARLDPDTRAALGRALPAVMAQLAVTSA
ncbi:MarR family winged helix-turn-helix transcriptional regulator [Nocardia sp. NPDC056100]|uniref:MarR family winged helix-turn-helix transcriptional regulator n=1 Tax=Nocardia sp. NPDC056100 TaxID=3345712 RepID=UPI0035DB4D97